MTEVDEIVSKDRPITGHMTRVIGSYDCEVYGADKTLYPNGAVSYDVKLFRTGKKTRYGKWYDKKEVYEKNGKKKCLMLFVEEGDYDESEDEVNKHFHETGEQ